MGADAAAGWRLFWGHLRAAADAVAAILANPAGLVRHVRGCCHAGRRLQGLHQSCRHLCGVQ